MQKYMTFLLNFFGLKMPSKPYFIRENGQKNKAATLTKNLVNAAAFIDN